MGLLDKIIGGGLSSVLDSTKGILDKFIADPGQKQAALLELEKETNRHQEALIESANKETESFLKDRQSARDMQIEALKQQDKFSRRYVYYLATFVICSASAFGVLLFFLNIPPENKRLVEMFADLYLFAGGMMVLSFFFGSSKSSKDKTEMFMYK